MNDFRNFSQCDCCSYHDLLVTWTVYKGTIDDITLLRAKKCPKFSFMTLNLGQIHFNNMTPTGEIHVTNFKLPLASSRLLQSHYSHYSVHVFQMYDHHVLLLHYIRLVY